MCDAFFAGSFDAFTLGHLCIVEQASEIYKTLYLLIAPNLDKTRRYPREEIAIPIKKQ